MKHAFGFLTMLWFATSTCFGQTVMPDNLRAANTIDRLGNFQGTNVPDFLYGIPFPPGKVIGDTYLNTEFNKTTILLYEADKVIEGYGVRYDIQLNELEVNAKNGIKVLPGGKVKSFVWIDEKSKLPQYFINAKEFKNYESVPLMGFFEVLSDGKLPLVKKTSLLVKKADYNTALNVGSHDDKILKKNELFYLKDGKVYKLSSTKKKILPLFGSRSEEMEKFITDNNLSLTKEDHLITVFNQYNLMIKI